MKKVLKIVGETIVITLFFAELYFIMGIGTAWENGVRCKNGAKIYCQTQGVEDGKVSE